MQITFTLVEKEEIRKKEQKKNFVKEIHYL